MATIQERWDELPIPEKKEIAEAAGLQGRISSSTWEKLHKNDQEALVAWSEQGREDKFVGDETELTVVEEEKSVDEVLYEAIKGETPVQDYLLWVGTSSYPTIADFIREAEGPQGVCRRVSKIPNGLQLNKSKIFLAHDEGETGDGVIFAYFVPTAVEVIVYRNSNGVPEDIKDIATPVCIDDAKTEQKRGCGYREDIGAIYIACDFLVVLKPYKDYNAIIHPKAKRFRGMKKVSANKIMNGKAKSAPSQRHRVKRSEKMARKRKQPWTEDERAKLVELVGKFGMWRGLREMQKINGRSIMAISYQWCKLKKQMEGEDAVSE